MTAEAGAAGVSTVRFVISGRVQGVGFRYFVRETALALGLSGWVRNLPEGSVEVEASGPSEAIARLEAALRTGPSGARVDRLVSHIAADTDRRSGFQIVR